MCAYNSEHIKTRTKYSFSCLIAIKGVAENSLLLHHYFGKTHAYTLGTHSLHNKCGSKEHMFHLY